MESSYREEFFGELLNKIGLTIWCPDFRDGHRTELCSIAETLSYVVRTIQQVCQCQMSNGDAPKSLRLPECFPRDQKYKIIV